jgi:hypothetical protein
MKQAFLSAVLLTSVVPTMAAVGSSASLTELRYELVDLDSNDGITPSMRFTGVSDAKAKAGSGFCDRGNNCTWTMGDFTHPARASFALSDISSAFATASAAGLFAGGTFNNALDTPSGREDVYEAFAGYRGVAGKPMFVLSANTGLRITGQYMLDAWSDPFRDPGSRLRGTERSWASVFFRSRFIEGPEPGREIQAMADWLSEPDHVHETGEISVLMRNDLDHQATLWGRWGVLAHGWVPGIPEPSTYALMAAGLGLVGWVVRRRRCATAPG